MKKHLWEREWSNLILMLISIFFKSPFWAYIEKKISTSTFWHMAIPLGPHLF